jgi:hypothetical protein
MQALLALPALQMKTQPTHHLLLLLLLKHCCQMPHLQQQLLARVLSGPLLLQLLPAVQGS